MIDILKVVPYIDLKKRSLISSKGALLSSQIVVGQSFLFEL
jgi:hypothetical protein